ncbi:Holliday junction resolvase RuvX [Candidatus Hepatincolaceae symbiont of Richtersius coronifer]
MIIKNIEVLISYLVPKDKEYGNKDFHKIMGLDVSKKHLGIALSDFSLTLAFPYKIIVRSALKADLQLLISIINQENIKIIIIGYPLSLEGKEEGKAQSIRTFADCLLKEIEVNIYFQDERFSTQFSKNHRIENLSKNLKKGQNLALSRTKIAINVDDRAAAWFLQAFLDKVKHLKISN